MHTANDKMAKIPTEKIITMKRREEQIKARNFKYEALCPYHAFYNPCPNLIKNDYCPYWHVEDCRKAYFAVEEKYAQGEKPDEKDLHNIVTQNAISAEQK